MEYKPTLGPNQITWGRSKLDYIHIYVQMVPFWHSDKGCKFNLKNMINILSAAALATLHRRTYFNKHATITWGEECSDAMIQSGIFIFALLLQLSSWMFLCTTNNAARYCEMSLLFNYSLSTSQSLLDAGQHVLNLIKCSTDFVGTPGWACTDPHEAVLQYRTLMWELLNSAKGGY